MKTAEQPVGEALAIFAHELRQPLSSILFAVRSLYESRGEEPSNREMCEVVERQARIMAQMIEEVLDVSRCRLGRLPLAAVCFDLRQAVALAVESTTPLFSTRGLRLTQSFPIQPVKVDADPLRIQQVLTNLLANAAKFTEPGGRIHVEVRKTPLFVVIEVRDNGRGIPQEVLPRIFGLFEQGNAPQHREWSGLGIGLALVKSLVELHGGDISVHSEGLGLGSAFVVRLPVAECTGNIRPRFSIDTPVGP